MFFKVRIEGATEMVSEEESMEYFKTRPRSSQIGAHVSKQSSWICSRDVLAKSNKELESYYREQEVPKPPYW